MIGKTGGAASKIGAGKSIINRHDRSFKRGTLMFIEGESSTEMFIIRSGLVRILKQEGDNTIELAQLGPGSVLGELSLLDHQPRGATAQVVEDTSVVVIDEELFTRTLKSIPGWLENMIQLVVKRLRDTMKKTSNDSIQRSIDGVIQVLLLLHARQVHSGVEGVTLSMPEVREQVHAVIGLGQIELEDVFLHLILKEFLCIRKNDAGREFVKIKNVEALRLYMQYLRVHQRGGELVGESLPESAVELLAVIISAVERNGVAAGKNLYRISQQQIEIELERSGKERFVDRDALEALTGAKLLLLQTDITQSQHGRHTRSVYICNTDLLANVLQLKKLLPVFTEEIVN